MRDTTRYLLANAVAPIATWGIIIAIWYDHPLLFGGISFVFAICVAFFLFGIRTNARCSVKSGRISLRLLLAGPLVLAFLPTILMGLIAFHSRAPATAIEWFESLSLFIGPPILTAFFWTLWVRVAGAHNKAFESDTSLFRKFGFRVR